jgi:hypothetical protein
MRSVERFNQRSRKIYNAQDVLKNHILKRYPILYTDTPEDYTQIKKYAGQHEFVWIVDKSISVLRSFPWHFKPAAKDKDAAHLFPYVYKKSRRVKSWKKIQLVPTNYQGEKVVTHPHICAIYDAYKGKEQFDMFFLGDESSKNFKKLKEKFSNIRAVESHSNANDLSETDMFWLVPDDITVNDTFKFTYEPDEWSFKYTHVFGNGSSTVQDGVALFPKNYDPTEKELTHRFYANKKEVRIVASKPIPYEKFKLKSYDEYLDALKNSKTDLFWYIPDDVTVKSSFDFNMYFDHHNQYDRNINHVFLNDKSYDGVALFSKKSPVTKKEFENRFYVNKKEWDLVASEPKSYDSFQINNYNDYLNALTNSKTEMFWGIPNDVKVLNNLNLYYTHHNQYDRNITHVFLNDKSYDGIALFSKNVNLTEKEINSRFYVNKKEHDEIYSIPKPYDFFEIDSYKEYQAALKNSSTELFWMSSRNISVNTDLIENFYISHHESIDRKQNHVFVHRVKNNDYFNGLFLCSKHAPLTEREVEHRHIVNRKEWSTVGSTSKKYDVFVVNNYDDYKKAFENSKTELFWAVPDDVQVEFDYDLYFTHDNEYDRKTNHIMLNSEHRDGIVLFSKHSPVSKKEVENRFYVNKKDWNIIASVPKQFDQFVVDTYNDYLTAKEKSTTEMFWMIPPEVNIADDFKFNFYINHHNKFDRNINHVFKNGKAYDGISLLSKNLTISEREISMRFFADKKQYEIVASNPTPYDIVFISKDEKYADQNYEKLKSRFARAHRVTGVEGIHNAHIAAAQLCETDLFWVVDGDAEIIDNFHFDYYVPRYDPDGKKTVHVWKAVNPINNLIYGYGAVKLLPRDLTLKMDISKPDMTTSISPFFKTVNRVSNTTRFNTDPFTTWRSAFRECVKLSSKTIDGQLDEETEFRLNAWCTRGKDKEFGEYCLAGAQAGKLYGEQNANNNEALRLINDFKWLEEQFNQSYRSV